MTYQMQDIIHTVESTREQNAKWTTAYNRWLESKAENSRRPYQRAWDRLLTFTGKQPWEISAADLENFTGEMRRKVSPSTLHQMLAAISSFYQYAQTRYVDMQDGQEIPLYYYNPAKMVDRPKIQQYGKAHPLTSDEARTLLQTIDRETVLGKRDYALILAYLATGRRNTEIRTLTWGQIEHDGQRIWYRWQGKRDSGGKYELPAPVWHAICDYLSTAGRLASMSRCDHIFTAITDHASRFPGVDHDPDRPLSSRYIRDLVKKYARLAGLDPEQVRVHDLRHTAALLREDAGDDWGQICGFLGQANPKTTMIYLHKIGGRKDKSWSIVGQMLGL